MRAALQEKQKTVEAESLELLKKGILQNDLSATGAVNYAARIAEDCTSFAAEYQLPEPSVTAPCSFATVPAVRKELSIAIQLLRNQNPILQNQGVVLAKKSRLEGLKTSLASQKQVVTAAENDLRNYPEKRSEEELDTAISELQNKVQGVDAEMLVVSRNAKLLSDALEFFMGRPDAEDTECPVCGIETKSVSEWRTHIEAELLSKKIKPLQGQKSLLTQSITALQESRRAIATLKSRLADERKRLAGQGESVEAALGKKLQPTDDPHAILEDEIQQLTAKLASLNDQVASVNAKLADLEDRLRDLDHFERIGKAQRQMEQIEGITSHPRYQELNTIRAQADQYAEDVELVIEGVSNAVRDEATKRLASAQTAISTNFAKITNRPDYQGLKVTANSDGYAIELTNPRGSVKAIPILNHADLNCCALSIFMALAASPQISHELGFVILDDPSQSFDSQVRKNLCNALSDLGSSRQLIVATADDGLAADVQAITKNKVSYLLKDWKPGVGPNISKTN